MHRVGFLLTHGFQVMAIGTQSVFEIANTVAREEVYSVVNYSLSGGDVRSSLGLSVSTRPIETDTKAETWMIGGTIDPLKTAANSEELAFVRHAARTSRRIAGLCTGAFVLADAGLLDGRRATTHWAYVDVLKKRRPRVQVEPDRIFIADDGTWTSAGLTAAMDLALAMVERDLGSALATRVAQALVMHQRRSGGQSQHSEMLKLSPKSDRVQLALEYARNNLSKPLSVDDLARVANLSTRQFGRVFQAETGQSPAKAVEKLRLEEARNMVERGRHPLEIIARETGFR
ncbi:transcriptional regulator, AraC family with amidase-like domain [Dyella jiangningensis]|uniref:GlxA family transcriptional regulator n=1 Tax=Dyella sp. AtDHG13 TaxID=1938897 RepID=UPI000882F8DD|nr:DJ-1/PfpI family protein [Dyella sp. AtDHG13]PXV56879.1 AraC family transcriptional regulator with amidase-like domain [Dyella sp. AtDHG13]SDK59404.1 transcriptional regulator, AraC family with amidase-like domain [Dyella jiangningensis]